MATSALGGKLNSVYFTNSGSEATEGAMKLAKRYTGRSKIISFKNSYHGSTQGALSVMGSEYWQQAFRPLLPNIYQFSYGSAESIESIDAQTACVIMEPLQSEAGINIAEESWYEHIRKKCDETGALLIFDEIQTGFGRNGKLFAKDRLLIEPDVILLGKALGGGLPLGAFVASKKMMDCLSSEPILGHITTFGGHPLSCAAGLASLEVIENLFLDDLNFVFDLEEVLHKQLKHPKIQTLKTYGLLGAIHFTSYEDNKKVIDTCIKNGLFTDWFLFAAQALRIAPPLTISTLELNEACQIILKSIDEALD